jgi:hypothetical protein
MSRRISTLSAHRPRPTFTMSSLDHLKQWLLDWSYVRALGNTLSGKVAAMKPHERVWRGYIIKHVRLFIFNTVIQYTKSPHRSHRCLVFDYKLYFDGIRSGDGNLKHDKTWSELLRNDDANWRTA